MFSSAAGRVVRSSSALPPPSACAFALPTVLGAAQKPFARSGHQRRLSSSKASTPPNNSKKDQELARAAQYADESAATAASKARGQKVAAVPAPALNIPYVQPTDHLDEPQVMVSSFFSLHRPMSVDRDVPPEETDFAAFDSIFAPRVPHSRQSIADNIQTLEKGIQSLEVAPPVYEMYAPPEEVAQMERQGGQLQVSLKDLMARLVPFRPPPPPMPVSDAHIFEIAEPAVEDELDQFEVRQPFLHRMNQRQDANNSNRDMFAISVKRQRKLKMKKHKYKKLMKRTRLLRRKLDRA